MKSKTGGEYPTELAADVIIPSGLQSLLRFTWGSPSWSASCWLDSTVSSHAARSGCTTSVLISGMQQFGVAHPDDLHLTMRAGQGFPIDCKHADAVEEMCTTGRSMPD